MFCNKCGQGLMEGTYVCPNCGNVLSSNSAPANSGARLKSTFSGANSMSASAQVDVNKTYCMPVEFESAPAQSPAPNPVSTPSYTPGSPYSTPVPPTSSYSGGYGYSAPTPVHASYGYDSASKPDRSTTESKGVGGRIAKTILVSVLLILVLFGPTYGVWGGLLPDEYNNAFEMFEYYGETLENIDYYLGYNDSMVGIAAITEIVAFCMLFISVIGSFISGLCNGKGGVRAFSVLGIVSLALLVTAIAMFDSATNDDLISRAFDPDRGIIHIGFYAAFTIFIVNCAIANKD